MLREVKGDLFQWLRGFYYTAQSGSLTSAAAKMNRNQPTLSYQIKCLEEEFGVTLFDRSHRTLKLNNEGRRLFERTMELFEFIQETKDSFDPNNYDLCGEISIGATFAVLYRFLPKYVFEFNQRYPNVQFKLEGRSLEKSLRRLMTSELDMVIGASQNLSPKLVFEPLFSTALTLITPKNKNFFRTNLPSLKQIAEKPFIALPENTAVGHHIESCLSRENIRLNKILVLNNFELVKKYVEIGMGVSILGEYALSKEDEMQFNLYPLNQLFPKMDYGVIMRKQMYIPPALKAFLESLLLCQETGLRE